jgi:hypothetical protein
MVQAKDLSITITPLEFALIEHVPGVNGMSNKIRWYRDSRPFQGVAFFYV